MINFFKTETRLGNELQEILSETQSKINRVKAAYNKIGSSSYELTNEKIEKEVQSGNADSLADTRIIIGATQAKTVYIVNLRKIEESFEKYKGYQQVRVGESFEQFCLSWKSLTPPQTIVLLDESLNNLKKAGVH